MSDREEPQDVTGAFSALVAGFGLKPRQQSLVIRILWVLAVSGHIAWVCGFLAVIGLPSPFARADEVKGIQQTLEASARVTLGREIREQSRVRCSATDQAIIDSITRYIDSLQTEYERIAGQRYPEMECRRP